MEEETFNNPTYKDGFAGDRRYLKGFLAKMDLIFMIHPDKFAEDSVKVAYLISRLYGSAMNWAATLLENRDPCLDNYEEFVTRFKAIFGDYDSTFIANQKLRTIKQRRLGDVRSYILEFNKYSDESSWNEEAKMDAFLVGLNDQVATRILEMFPGPRTLIAMQTIASRIDSRLSAHKQFFNQQNKSNNYKSKNNNIKKSNFSKKPSNPKFRGPLSNEEKERRRRENLCAYCGSAEHSLENCSLKNKYKKSTTSAHISNFEFKPRPRISDQPNIKLPIFEFNLKVSNIKTKAKILLDSGSQLSLMDKYFVKENNIPVSTEITFPKVSGIGGNQSVIGETLPISVQYNNHICKVKFYVIDLPSYCAILGVDWLSTHNPSINFATKELAFKSNHCVSNCLVIPSTFTTYIPQKETKFNEIREIKEINNNNNDIISDRKCNKINVNVCNIINPKTCNNSNNKINKEINDELKNKINRSLPKKLIPFKDVFSEIYANELPPHRPYDCEINLLPNTQLFYGPIYPLTEKESKTLKEYIVENLAKGFIRKSKSPGGAPVFFVLKKNGELRMVVDYRHLNDITIRDSYPLPLINDMLEHLVNGKVFSKLDLRSAYNLVRIKKGDEYKTAFTCKYGHFEYLVMPFGLKNAPAVFQHFINDVLEDILGVFAFCYIDDIIVFSPDLETHYEHLSEVLRRLRKAGLFAKLEKCEFCVPYLDFLGHRISCDGIFMDPKKVSSILEWPVPLNVKQLQSFLGLANYYRRFIPGFAAITHPLHSLLKKNTKFLWSTETQDAFDNLKSKFSSAPVLAYPNRDLPFLVETDSSNFAIGAILSQTSSKDNKIHPVAFFSRSLTATEKNYPIYDKELLAIIEALEHWRHLLKGTSKPFTIFSDHRNLLYQKKPEKMSQRLVRWALFLSEFNFKITYRAGSANGKADALSRRPDYAANKEELDNDIPFTVLHPENFSTMISFVSLNDQILSEYNDDKFYKETCNKLNSRDDRTKPKDFCLSNNFLLFKGKIYVPPSCRSSVLNICHDSPSAGHFGFKKTFSLINRDFWWPTMSSDIISYIRSCEICCRSKTQRHKPYGFLNPLEIPDRPWTSISMDFITDLPPSNGFTCIFVVLDRFSKMGHFIPFPNVPSSEDTAQAFMKYIFKLHGLPNEIFSDRGTQFTSKLWTAICKSLNISMKLSSPFHHQTNGLTERVNSVIEQFLRCYSNFKGSNWNEYLFLAEFCYNNSVQESLKKSPFYANYGYNPRFSPAVPNNIDVPRAEELTKNLSELFLQLKENLKLASKKQETFANKHRMKAPEFKINDKVWINSSLVIRNKNKKLKPRKLGPYKIIRKVSPVSYELELPKNIRIHPVIHVSELEPYYEDKFGRKQKPPPPIIVNEEEEYEVEEILDKRKHYGKIQYLIKWKGYPLSEASWEPESNLNCPELLKKFNKAN